MLAWLHCKVFRCWLFLWCWFTLRGQKSGFIMALPLSWSEQSACPEGSSWELQLSFAGPKSTLMEGDQPLLMGSCHHPAGSATSPSHTLQQKLNFHKSNYVDIFCEAFSFRGALLLGALWALWSFRAGTDLMQIIMGGPDVLTGGARSAKGSEPPSCNPCTSRAAHNMVWMCGESKMWFRGTDTWRCLKSRAVVFNLWAEGCTALCQKTVKVSQGKANQNNTLAAAACGKPLA